MNEFLQLLRDSVIAFPAETLTPGLNYLTIAVVLTVFCFVIFAKQLRHRKNYAPKKLASFSKQLRRELFYSILSQFMMLVTGVVLYFTFRNVGFYGKFYENFGGWNPIIFAVLTFVVLIVSHDTYFYWTHRLMHHPKVFKYTHKVHHLSKDINPLTSVAFHPFEAIIQASWNVLPAILFPFSPIGSVVFGLVELVHTVYAHLGYELYPSGFTKNWLTKHIITSTHHNMHHERVGGNYGLYFMWWDWAMKTEFKDYHDRFESLADSKKVPIQVVTN